MATVVLSYLPDKLLWRTDGQSGDYMLPPLGSIKTKTTTTTKQHHTTTSTLLKVIITCIRIHLFGKQWMNYFINIQPVNRSILFKHWCLLSI